MIISFKIQDKPLFNQNGRVSRVEDKIYWVDREGSLEVAPPVINRILTEDCSISVWKLAENWNQIYNLS